MSGEDNNKDDNEYLGSSSEEDENESIKISDLPPVEEEESVVLLPEPTEKKMDEEEEYNVQPIQELPEDVKPEEETEKYPEDNVEFPNYQQQAFSENDDNIKNKYEEPSVQLLPDHVESQSVLSDHASINLVEEKMPKEKKKIGTLLFVVLWILFALQGIAAMLPFNVYVSAPDYFEEFFGKNIMTIISFTFLLPNCAGGFILTFFGNSLLKPWGIFFTYVLPYAWFIISLLVFPFFKLWGVMEINWLGWVVTLAFIFVSGAGQSFLQSVGFSWAYVIDPQLSTAVSSGYGLCGVIVAIVRYITKFALLGDTKKDDKNANYISALCYFELAAIFMIFLFFCLILQLYLIFRVKKYLNEDEEDDEFVSEDPDKEEESPIILDEEEEDEKIDEVEKNESLSFKDTMKIYVRCIQIMWYNGILIFSVFTVTLSVFPGIVAAIPVSFPDTWWSGWFAVIIISFFMFGDCTGRMSPIVLKRFLKYIPILEFHVEVRQDEEGNEEVEVVKNPFNFYDIINWNLFKSWLVIFRFSFVCFYIIFYCTGYYIPGFDFAGMALMVVLAVTNGFLTSTILEDGAMGLEFHAKKLKEKGEDWLGEFVGDVGDYQARGAQLMVFCMLTGIFMGSLLELGIFYLFGLFQQDSWY